MYFTALAPSVASSLDACRHTVGAELRASTLSPLSISAIRFRPTDVENPPPAPTYR
jgi:hypothetical protein